MESSVSSLILNKILSLSPEFITYAEYGGLK